MKIAVSPARGSSTLPLYRQQLDVMLDVNCKDEKSIAEVVVGAGSCLVGSEGSS